MNSFQALESLMLWVALQVLAPSGSVDAQALGAEQRWGVCYAQAYRANHPKQARVEEPVVAFTQGTLVRPEVWTCRQEFEAWLRSKQLSGFSSLYEKQVARVLARAFAFEEPERQLAWGQVPSWRGVVTLGAAGS